MYGDISGGITLSLNDPSDDNKVRLDDLGGDSLQATGVITYSVGIYFELDLYIYEKRWEPDALNHSGKIQTDDIF